LKGDIIMNRTFQILLIVCVVICLVCAIFAGQALSARQSSTGRALPAGISLVQSQYGQEGLRVSAAAEVRTAPDIATVRLGYESRALHAREAKVANDAVMVKVIKALQQQGIARKDIQTSEYRLFPVWEDWPTPTTRTRFWHILHIVTVRIHKVDTSADVIDAASSAGADKIEDVQFAIEDIHKLRAQAREMAAKVAREKGQQLANLMGVKLGRVVAINDANPVRYWYSPHMASNAQAVAEAPADGGSPDSIISGGQVVVEAREEVTFALD
jgi:uncharacterized protein